MTEKEMQEARSRLYAIEQAREQLTKLTNQLSWVNKVAKANKQYQVPIDLQDGDSYRRSTTIYIFLSPGVVQQSLIREIESVRRTIVKFGGSL